MKLDVWGEFLGRGIITCAVIVLGVVAIVAFSVWMLKRIHRKRAFKYMREHMDELVDKNAQQLLQCDCLGKRLIEQYETYNSCANSLNLNHLHKCSSSVVSNSYNDSIKYLMKYSNVSRTKECIETVSYCQEYLRCIKEYRSQVAQVVNNLAKDIPASVLQQVHQSMLPFIFVETYEQIDRIKNPNFVFLYTSPKGNSYKSNVIVVTDVILQKIYDELTVGTQKTVGFARNRISDTDSSSCGDTSKNIRPVVSSVAKSAKQPRGGYLPIKSFSVSMIEDGAVLNENENVVPTIVGLAVDYLTRYMLTGKVREAFHVSFVGYQIKAAFSFQSGELTPQIGNNILSSFSETDGVVLPDDKVKGVDILSLFSKICGLDDDSIIAACRAVSYDVYVRSGPEYAVGAETIVPNKETIENIRTMVTRSVNVIKCRGKNVVKTGFQFCDERTDNSEDRLNRPGSGYTRVVAAGDGDILTEDTMYDMKVSKNKPTSKESLQLLMYWIMGKHSQMFIYQNTRYITLLNPRRGEVYTMDTSLIDRGVIESVERDIICY